MHIGTQQRPVAQHIEQAGHAAAQAIDPADQTVREELPRSCGNTGNLEAVPEIGGDLRLVQRSEVIAGDDPLRQLAQIRSLQHPGQFRLTQQDDLQQFALVGLQVGEQAHLLQHVDREILCLVDDQHRMSAPGVGVEQVAVEAIDEDLDAGIAGRKVNAEFDAEARQQLLHGQLRVEYVGNVAGIGNLFEQAAAHRGLARAHLAGQQDEAAAAFDAIQQMGERFLMALAHVQVTRIRRDRKGRLAEAEILQIHGAGTDFNAPL